LRERAAERSAQAKEREQEWRAARKGNETKLAELEATWRATEREAREALAQAEAIEDAVYDLKAVNPNRTSEEDTRTPAELLDFIETKGREGRCRAHQTAPFNGQGRHQAADKMNARTRRR
jgi:type I restriction enzyme M protein